jgi:hypothetical protein
MSFCYPHRRLSITKITNPLNDNREPRRLRTGCALADFMPAFNGFYNCPMAPLFAQSWT